jgi:ABC-type nickel/cobalt efflux system permease component RcnA
MTTGSPLAILGLGFVLGLRHALDVDHLAAVSTIVSRRRTVWRSALVGVAWGLGHTTSLLAVAIGVIGLHADVPPRLQQGLELGVASMLVALGVRLLHRVIRGDALHAHAHVHDGRPHRHPHWHRDGSDAHEHAAGHRRSFLVGLVHGLAGSGGLMLAVAATIPDRVLAVGYVAIFGVGSIGGMATMSALFAIPSVLTARRFAGADRWLGAGAALASVAVGIAIGWDIGRAAGFLA